MVGPSRDPLSGPLILELVRAFGVATISPRLALTPDEAARSLGISRDYLDEHIASELRWVRRGRRKLVAVRELEAWLERSAERTLPEEP